MSTAFRPSGWRVVAVALLGFGLSAAAAVLAAWQGIDEGRPVNFVVVLAWIAAAAYSIAWSAVPRIWVDDEVVVRSPLGHTTRVACRDVRRIEWSILEWCLLGDEDRRLVRLTGAWAASTQGGDPRLVKAIGAAIGVPVSTSHRSRRRHQPRR